MQQFGVIVPHIVVILGDKRSTDNGNGISAGGIVHLLENMDLNESVYFQSTFWDVFKMLHAYFFL